MPTISAPKCSPEAKLLSLHASDVVGVGALREALRARFDIGPVVTIMSITAISKAQYHLASA